MFLSCFLFQFIVASLEIYHCDDYKLAKYCTLILIV